MSTNRIPIANLYYLLCYAWDKLPESELIEVSPSTAPDAVNLLGRVLASGLSHLLKRGLGRDYQAEQMVTSRPRGSISFSRSMGPLATRPGRLACRAENLSHDTLANRILAATMSKLVQADVLEDDLRHQIRDQLGRMREVSGIRLSANAFRRVQLDRNSSFYGFLLNVCWLVHEGLALDRASGRVTFRDFDDSARMPYVFQQFVRNLLRIHGPGDATVSAPILQWAGATGDEEALERLPQMETDIVVRWRGDAVVLDTKYYFQAFQSSWGKETVRSDHLYQLLSYLRNLPFPSEKARRKGLLLYPAVQEGFHFRYELHGHQVSVASVDLRMPWKEIEGRLLYLVYGDFPPAS